MENQTPPSNPTAKTPVSQVPPVSQQNQTPPPAIKASKFSIRTIVGIIFFFLLAGGAAAGYVYKDKIVSLVAKPTPSLTPVVYISPTPTPAPTTDWKTYIGNGFTFKYPKSFDHFNCPQSFGTYTLCTINQDSGPEPLFYFIFASKETILPNQYKYITSTIHGLQMFETTDAPSRSGADSVYIKKSDNSYVYIFFTPYDQQKPFPNQDKFHTSFEQILSTFKFTDSQTLDTSSWKTFDVENFSFRTPSTWKERQTTVTIGGIEKVITMYEGPAGYISIPSHQEKFACPSGNSTSIKAVAKTLTFCFIPVENGEKNTDKWGYIGKNEGFLSDFTMTAAALSKGSIPTIETVLKTFKFTN